MIKIKNITKSIQHIEGKVLAPDSEVELDIKSDNEFTTMYGEAIIEKFDITNLTYDNKKQVKKEPEKKLLED